MNPPAKWTRTKTAFFYVHLNAASRICRLTDPAHRLWHESSLQTLMLKCGRGCCHVDAVEGPVSYFDQYNVSIDASDFSPEKLNIGVQRVTGSLWGVNVPIYRYQLNSENAKEHAPEWLSYCEKPVVVWFSGMDSPDAVSHFVQNGRKGAMVMPPSPNLVAVYFWDCPQLELFSNCSLNISELLTIGWRRSGRYNSVKGPSRYIQEIVSLGEDNRI